jgi:hypothetical protein
LLDPEIQESHDILNVMNFSGQKMNPRKALSTEVFESWNTIISNDEKARKEKKALKANKEKKEAKEKGQVKRKY